MAVFVHEAWLALAKGADSRAPGAAVTVALCGHSEHEGPCHSPHHTSAEPKGGKLVVRILFAVDAADEATVRGKIVPALRESRVPEEAAEKKWTLLSETIATPTAEESARGERIGEP